MLAELEDLLLCFPLNSQHPVTSEPEEAQQECGQRKRVDALFPCRPQGLLCPQLVHSAQSKLCLLPLL